MPHAYTEDQLVEQPAIELFAELGWQVAGPPTTAGGVGEPRDAGLLGRETKGEVVLVPRLRAALAKLNPTSPPEAIAAAMDELTRDRSSMLLEQANREVYRLLKEGIPVSVADTGDATPPPARFSGRGGESRIASSGLRPPSLQRREGRGGQKTVRLRVIDWEQPADNDLLLVRLLGVTGALCTCRPDLVGFVNGLPLVVVEFKKPGVPARTAFDENLSSYKHPQNGIPALFVFNALLIASMLEARKRGQSFANNEVRNVVVQCAAQTAKSQTALACLCWVIAEDPGHGMWVIARLASGDANQR